MTEPHPLVLAVVRLVAAFPARVPQVMHDLQSLKFPSSSLREAGRKRGACRRTPCPPSGGTMCAIRSDHFTGNALKELSRMPEPVALGEASQRLIRLHDLAVHVEISGIEHLGRDRARP